MLLVVLFATPWCAFAADKVAVSKGDRVVVTLDQAAIIDKDNNSLTKVAKGDTLSVVEDRANTEWIPVEITVDGKVSFGWISTLHARRIPITEGLMARALAILIHILVVAGILLMITFMFQIIARGHDSTEQLLRSCSLGAGLLGYVAAKAYGLSIPDLLASSLSVVSPFSTGLWCVTIPAFSGTFVAWFSLRMLKRSENVGARVVVMFCAFIFTMFSDVYATLAGEITSSQAKYGLPNSTFVLGIVLYLIFKYERTEVPTPEKTGRSRYSRY